MPLISLAIIRERVAEALEIPRELPGLEFKQGLPFESLQYRITKTCMGMANLRDGGLLIIGVAQEDVTRRFLVDGIVGSDAVTYVQEPVSEFVTKYSSPPVEIHVVPVERQGKLFVAIAVSPFERTPVVCKKNTPDDVSANDAMHVGDFFVRTGDPVATQRVKNEAMMHELLDRAAGRRAADIVRILREGGVRLEDASIEPPGPNYDAEISDIADVV